MQKFNLTNNCKKGNNSQCFTVLANDITDIFVTEKLTLCVRFIDEQNNANESFVKFIEIHSLTGKNLTNLIYMILINFTRE